MTRDFAGKTKSPASESLFGAEHASIARWEQQYCWTPAAQGKVAEGVWQSTMLVTTLSAANAFTSQTHCTKDSVEGLQLPWFPSTFTWWWQQHMLTSTESTLHWWLLAGRHHSWWPPCKQSSQDGDAELWICPWHHSDKFLPSCLHYSSHSSFTHNKKKQLLLSIITFGCFQTQHVDKFP